MKMSANFVDSTRINFPAQIYSCTICETKFLHESRKKLHEFASHHVQHERFPCSTCGQMFFQESELLSHYEFHNVTIERTSHRELHQPRNIEIELPAATEAAAVQVHNSEEIQPNPVIVNPDSGGNTTELADQTENSGTIEQKRHECPTCGKSFAYGGSLKLHAREHDASLATRYFHAPPVHKCYFCVENVVLKTLRALERHLATSHVKRKSYSCDACNFTSKKALDFNNHIPTHGTESTLASNIRETTTDAGTGDDTESTSASNIPETTTDHGTGDQTVDNHSDKLVHRCYLCNSDTRFENKELLLAHLRAKHPAKDKYECKECKHTSNRKVYFNNHLSRHDPSRRPFKCAVCPTRFNSRRYVRLHEITVHKSTPAEATPASNILETTDHGTGDQAVDNQNAKRNNLGVQDVTISEQPELMVEADHTGVIKAEELQLSPEPMEDEDTALIEAPPLESRENSSSPTGGERIRTKNGKLIHRCYLCKLDTRFETRKHLVVHLKEKHPAKDKYECKECKHTAHDKVGFNVHLSRHDSSRRPFKCGICPLRFNSRRYVRCHEATAHNSKSVDASPKKVNQKPIVQSPKKKIDRRRKKEYGGRPSCSKCGKVFLNNYMRRRHEATRVCELAVQKCYLCPGTPVMECKTSLRQHLENAHADEPSYECTVKKCNYVSKSKFNFNEHLARHDPVTKPFKCSACTLRFRTMSVKLHHEAIKHDLKSKIKTYPCGDCNKIFLHKQNLLNHEERHRKQKKKPASKIRSASPSEVQELDRPVTRSSKNRFKCYLCVPSNALGSREELAQHLESGHHPQREVYRCEQCPFSVNTKTIFNQHLAQHDGAVVEWGKAAL